MKKRNFNKKLNLNKSVVSNLSDDQMVNVKGGVETDYHSYIQWTCTVLYPETYHCTKVESECVGFTD